MSAHVCDDDSTLVVAVQGGDLAAYEELFRRHHTSVKRVCARRLGNQVEADEVAQATFVRALERIDRCVGERRFGAWVQVIAQRLCLDMIRARTRTVPDDDPLRGERSPLNVVIDLDAGTVTEEAIVRRERTERMHEALALLPDRQREVVVARHLQGRRPSEIAAALGLSVGAVDSLLLRARRRLALNYEHVLAEGSHVGGTAATTWSGTVVSPGASAGGGAHGSSASDALAGLVREVVVGVPSGPDQGSPGPRGRAAVGLVAPAPPAVGALRPDRAGSAPAGGRPGPDPG
jgi:RNA polymerase sigma-70 factor (ECF subfamily)